MILKSFSKRKQSGALGLCKKKQEFKNQKPWYTFFRAPNMFAYTIMDLKIVVRAHVCTNIYLAVHLLQRQKYFRVKVNLRSIPLTINPEPSFGIPTVFIKKETTDGSLVYPEPNNQTFFRHLCLKAMKMVGFSHQDYVGMEVLHRFPRRFQIPT